MSHDLSPREAELIERLRAIDVPAPEGLRRSTEALLAERAERGRGAGGRSDRTRRPALGLRAAGALSIGAAVAVALVLVLGGSSGSRSLNVREAAALTLLPATAGAPPESSSRRAQLAAAVEGLAFPYWGGRLGWDSSGSRTDRVAGRTIRTVFYRDGRSGERVGYAIVAGPPPATGGGTIVWRGGTPYRLQSSGSGRSIVWLRGGHLCVVSGHGVSDATLLRLASWDDHASVA